MSLASYFDAVPAITLHDRLSELLGASEDGMLEYRYGDAVRLAGHSCPTVAGAWLTACAGVRALYPDAIPERGDIRVSLPDAEDQGVTGVIGQVLTLVTGAAAANGFHGLGGNHRRSRLLQYAQPTVHGVQMQRSDTGATVEVQYDPRGVPADPEQMPMLGAIVQGQADAATRQRFGQLWQDRVRRILLDHAHEVIRVRRLA